MTEGPADAIIVRLFNYMDTINLTGQEWCAGDPYDSFRTPFLKMYFDKPKSVRLWFTLWVDVSTLLVDVSTLLVDVSTLG